MNLPSGALDAPLKCRYSNYMTRSTARTSHPRLELKVVAIGNSRGIRLPKAVLERYAVKGSLTLELHPEGFFLRNGRDPRLSWEETFREMARERENWSEFDATLGDGLGRDF